ncbi:helix-turn-helix domain-containing protein [Streptomyces albus]
MDVVRSPQELGAELRAARCRARLTQTQVGQAIGYSASAISRIESGRMRLGYDRLLALAGFLGVPPDRLTAGSVSAGPVLGTVGRPQARRMRCVVGTCSPERQPSECPPRSVPPRRPTFPGAIRPLPWRSVSSISLPPSPCRSNGWYGKPRTRGPTSAQRGTAHSAVHFRACWPLPPPHGKRRAVTSATRQASSWRGPTSSLRNWPSNSTRTRRGPPPTAHSLRLGPPGTRSRSVKPPASSRSQYGGRGTVPQPCGSSRGKQRTSTAVGSMREPSGQRSCSLRRTARRRPRTARPHWNSSTRPRRKRLVPTLLSPDSSPWTRRGPRSTPTASASSTLSAPQTRASAWRAASTSTAFRRWSGVPGRGPTSPACGTPCVMTGRLSTR